MANQWSSDEMQTKIWIKKNNDGKRVNIVNEAVYFSSESCDIDEIPNGGAWARNWGPKKLYDSPRSRSV